MIIFEVGCNNVDLYRNLYLDKPESIAEYEYIHTYLVDCFQEVISICSYDEYDCKPDNAFEFIKSIIDKFGKYGIELK